MTADEDLKQRIQIDFYVDDYLGIAVSIDEAHMKVTKLNAELLKYGLPLRKWSSSEPSIVLYLPEELRETNHSSKILDKGYKVKILGVRWTPNQDLTYTAKLETFTALTKRKLLSDASKLFDPLGWLGPIIIINYKLLLQLWVRGLSWDDNFPNEMAETWFSPRENLRQLDLKIPRCVTPKFKLHLFTGAREKAFPGCVYSQITTMDGDEAFHLIDAKTKASQNTKSTLS